MAMYYNGKKVRNLYYNGKCITRLALGKEMTHLVEGDDFVRAEWLCGRNGAYIDTMHPLSVFEDAFEIRARIADNTAPNPDGGENDLFGVMSDDGRRCICFYARNNGRLFFAYCNISSGGNQIYFENKNVFSAKMVADNSNFTVVCDGVSKSATVGSFQEYERANIALFQLTTIKSSNYFNGDIAYFRITDPTFSIDRVNMTPCRLLRTIPAILDGNGIARQAGECGMWDKVSNKFYGNVASSGTFTVKGPKCYEEYKWLNCYTADGATLPAQGADIGITPISLTNKVLTIELGQVSRNVCINGNSPYFIPIWCSRWQAYNEDYMTLQERKGNNNTLNEITCLWTTSNTITLDFINNVATLGNSTFQIEGTGYTFRGFNNSIWQNPRTVGRIKISDELDLVPCKLTHGIPASVDANGIARPAGTCGMWDKVNDKFYGNVANNGTFTVSDN